MDKKVFSIETVIEALADTLAIYGKTKRESDAISNVIFLSSRLAYQDGTYSTAEFILKVGRLAKKRGWKFAPAGIS